MIACLGLAELIASVLKKLPLIAPDIFTFHLPHHLKIPALAGALVILLAYIWQYLILSLKEYIAGKIIEAQTKHFIVTIKWNIRKCGSIIQKWKQLTILLPVSASILRC